MSEGEAVWDGGGGDEPAQGKGRAEEETRGSPLTDAHSSRRCRRKAPRPQGGEHAQVWGQDAGKAAALAERRSAKLGIEVKAVETTEAVARPTDIIVTTTPSTTPLVRAGWLSPGQHITAMGADAGHKNELSPAIIRAAGLYVCDSLEQCERLGETRHALEAGLTEPGTNFPDLGEIIAAKSAGRPSADATTVADLTGTGVQDTAIATLAYARAINVGAGTSFTS